jgi:hypothetical protein
VCLRPKIAAILPTGRIPLQKLCKSDLIVVRDALADRCSSNLVEFGAPVDHFDLGGCGRDNTPDGFSYGRS